MNTQLRIGHFSPDAPAVNVSVDGDLLLEDVSFGTLGDYVDVDAGSLDIEIVPASGGDAVISETIEIDADSTSTLLAIGTLAEIELLTLTDEQSRIEDEDARLRFVHTVPDAPAVDVMADGTIVFEDVSFGEMATSVTVDANSWDIDVRPAGSADSVLERSGLVFEGATGYTIIATGMLDDDSLDAMVVSDYVWSDDRATISR